MSRIDEYEGRPPEGKSLSLYSEPYVTPEVVEEPPQPRDYRTPLLLFLATLASTFYAYYRMEISDAGNDAAVQAAAVRNSLVYAASVVFILAAHEFGHFFQAMRYKVPGSLPYFIPMPISPIGTMGAVIGLRGMGDRRSLFDIAITGPIAGLIPALICCVVGLSWSTQAKFSGGPALGTPLVFQIIAGWFFEPVRGYGIQLHPLAFAGWVGIFITALNLIPIGQLDGGHILYALLRKKAHFVASALLTLAIIWVVVTGNVGWMLMLMLLAFIGPYHPPTSNDDAPLGIGRIILGWLMLAFVLIGFTPVPFVF